MIISSSFAAQLQKQQEKNLLQNAVQGLRLAEFGKKHAIKPNQNTKTVTFYRRAAADMTAAGAPTALTEGGQSLTDRDFTYTPVDIALTQIGQVGKVTDIVNNMGLLNFVKDQVAMFGEEAALNADGRIRDQLAHPTTGLTKMYAQKLANYAALAAATDSAGRLVPSDILRAKTKLEIARAPKINGKYVMIVPPQVSHDILNNAEWREVIRNQNADKYFKGVIGEISGVMIVEATNPYIEASAGAEGTYSATGNIFTSIILGAEAFGVVDMQSMGGSPFKPQVVILDKADKADRLNQFISVGWKAYWGSGVLNAAWGIALRSRTEFVG